MVVKNSFNKEAIINRLIDTSIEMFFTLKDLVPIHILASSANAMLTDLSKKQGVKMLIEQHILPDKISEWHKAERKAYNFMKHADKDISDKLDFDEDQNIWILFFCVLKFKNLYKKNTHTVRLFFLIFCSRKHTSFSS